MSRCFAYPPPGYSQSLGGKEALIETIKLQSENMGPTEKELRKEKKEKRKEKKERKKEEVKECKKVKKSNPYQNPSNFDATQLRTGEKSQTSAKIAFPPKVCQAQSDHLELSNITEEHGPPISLHAPTSSSDSTENSNKRKRQSSTDDVAKPRRVIRIRLTKKPSESDVPVNDQQLCSTSGRPEIPCKVANQISSSLMNKYLCSISKETSNLGLAHTKSSTSGGSEIPCKAANQIGSSLRNKVPCSTLKETRNLGLAHTKSSTSGGSEIPCKAANQIGSSLRNIVPCSTLKETRNLGLARTKSSTSSRPEIPCQVANQIGSSLRNKDPCSTSKETSNFGLNLALTKSSTSGRPEIPCKVANQIGSSLRNKDPCGVSKETSNLGLNLAHTKRPEVASYSRAVGPNVNRKSGTPPIVPAVITPMQRIELQYNNLFETWVPPPLQGSSTFSDSEDLEWLFKGKKNQVVLPTEKQISGNDIVYSSSSSLISYPRAQYLSEADVYALPYTVPF